MTKPTYQTALRSVARKVASAERIWRQSGNARHPESYGAGFARGMAEMARRIKVDCRMRAKSLESRTPKRKAKR